MEPKLDRAAQPLKALFILYQILTTILLRLPWWIISAIPRSKRPRHNWSLARTVRVRFLKHYFALIGRTGIHRYPNHTVLLPDAEFGGVWIDPVPNLITGEIHQRAITASVEPTRIPAYWMKENLHQGGVVNTLSNTEKVLYVIHGGGFSIESANPKALIAENPKAILHYATSLRCAFMVEYRLSRGPPEEPANPFPAALIDVIAGYHYLVNVVGVAPEKIVVEGDSAGGNLALALVRYLVENQAHSHPNPIIPPPPSRLILLSPWADVGLPAAGAEASVHVNMSSDFLDLSPTGSSKLRGNYLGPDIPRTEASKYRYISPGSNSPDMEASFVGYPETFIMAGGVEGLRDEIRVLSKKMKQDMGEDMVEYVEMPDSIHDFLLWPWHEPERSAVLQHMAEWLKSERQR